MQRLILLLALAAAVLVTWLVIALGEFIERVGADRIYSDLATAVLLVLVVGGVSVLIRVTLTGVAKVNISRNAHLAQPVQRETIIRQERHTVDGRPQVISLDQRRGDWGSLYPDMARSAMSGGMPPAQIGPAAYDVAPVEAPGDVWGELNNLFDD